jgi:hypothetical protein
MKSEADPLAIVKKEGLVAENDSMLSHRFLYGRFPDDPSARLNRRRVVALNSRACGLHRFVI